MLYACGSLAGEGSGCVFGWSATEPAARARCARVVSAVGCVCAVEVEQLAPRLRALGSKSVGANTLGAKPIGATAESGKRAKGATPGLCGKRATDVRGATTASSTPLLWCGLSDGRLAIVSGDMERSVLVPAHRGAVSCVAVSRASSARAAPT
eukprot:1981709-Pleurochrysis_carterae.AAC.1